MSKKRRITSAMIKSAIGHNKAAETGRISSTGCNEANTPKSEAEQPGDMLKALYEYNPAARAEMDKRNQERIDFVNSDAAEQFFIDVLSGKKTPVAKGRFSAKSKGDMTGVNKCSFRYKSPQVQQIPREDLVNMDYAVIEQRVVAMHPALAAPYGQTEKDQPDDQ